MEWPYLEDKNVQAHLDKITKRLTYLKNGRAYDYMPSTNTYALSLEKMGVNSGTFIIAARQSEGRGRFLRHWHMLEGDIALSLIVRPHASKISLMSIFPALAIVDTLAFFQINARLKWPNDIVIQKQGGTSLPYFDNFRKVGGILVENVLLKDVINASIIGIGLNIVPNFYLSKEVVHASNLREWSPSLEKYSFLERLLYCLDQRILALNSHSSSWFIEEYKKYCETLGREVVIKVSDKEILYGLAKDINSDGSLLVAAHDNEFSIRAGDVNFFISQEN